MRVRVDNDVAGLRQRRCGRRGDRTRAARTSPRPARSPSPPRSSTPATNVLALRARDRGDQRYIDARARRWRSTTPTATGSATPPTTARRAPTPARRTPTATARGDVCDGFIVALAPARAAGRRPRASSPRRSRTGARRERSTSVRLVPPAGLARAGRRGRAAPASRLAPGATTDATFTADAGCAARAATGRRPPARERPPPGRAALALLPDGTALGTARDGRLLAALRHRARRGAGRRSDQRHARSTPAGPPVAVEVLAANGGPRPARRPGHASRSRPAPPGRACSAARPTQPTSGGRAAVRQPHDRRAGRLPPDRVGARARARSRRTRSRSSRSRRRARARPARRPCPRRPRRSTPPRRRTGGAGFLTPVAQRRPGARTARATTSSRPTGCWSTARRTSPRSCSRSRSATARCSPAGSTNGLSRVQACFSAPYTFATRAGYAGHGRRFDGDGDGVPEDWWTRACCPSARCCGSPTPPPCVKERRLLRDGIAVVARLPGGAIDPKMRG